VRLTRQHTELHTKLRRLHSQRTNTCTNEQYNPIRPCTPRRENMRATRFKPTIGETEH
jgi:hypothetical protein